MKRAQGLFLLVLSVILPLRAGALAAPSIQSQSRKVGRVVLGDDVTSALLRFDPQFRVLEAGEFLPSIQEDFKTEAKDETPMAVVGDFNGDQIRDVVLMGVSRGERVVLGVVSGKNRFEVYVIQRRKYVKAENSYFPPLDDSDVESDEDESEIGRERGIRNSLGLVRAKGSGDGKRFVNDAVTVDTFRSPKSQLFHFENGTFREWKPHR